MDGTSLVPVLQNPDERVRDYAYHAFDRGGRMGRAIRTDKYRLVEWKEIDTERETADIELYEYSTGQVEIENIAETWHCTGASREIRPSAGGASSENFNHENQS